MSERRMTSVEILRQWAIFQLKLAADAMRDLLLSPISTVVLLLDLLLGNSAYQSYFQRLMRLGKRSDHFINLFSHNATRTTTIDAVVDEAERTFKERYRD